MLGGDSRERGESPKGLPPKGEAGDAPVRSGFHCPPRFNFSKEKDKFLFKCSEKENSRLQQVKSKRQYA